MKISVKNLAAIALAGCVVVLAATASAQDAKLKLPELKYETYTLPNGLKVIAHEDHRLPLVAVDVWYHVGPVNERAGRTGFAHLFEHMMFEGSEHIGEKSEGKTHIGYVEAAGATDVNGTTDFDRTNYFETLPSNQLELGLWLESDRMGFLMEGLNREKLANQRDVVRNERRQGEGRPYYLADEQMYHLLFPKEHPYFPDVMGSHADVEAARIADVRDFHQQYYIPNNASIAIAGDFDPKKLKDLLTKYFGPIPAGPTPPTVNVTTPAITSQRRATVTDAVQLPQVIVAWLTPAAYTPGAYDTDAAIYALGGGKASRLDEAMVYKAQLAQSVSCSTNALKLTGITQCSMTAKPGVKPEDLEATFWKELAKLQSEGPTEKEIDSAKTTDLTGKIVGLQRLGGFGGVADTLDSYNQYTGDPGFLPKDVAMAEAVTPASAKAAAAKYLTKDSSVVVYTVQGKKVLNDVPRSPEDTDAKVVLTNPYTPDFEASQQWRKTVPSPGAVPAFHLPVPQTFTLSNGLKVYLLEDHALPVLSASMVTRAGSENNPEGKGGLATLVAGTMGDGTKTLDLASLAEAEELIGTHIAPSATMDGASSGITVLTNVTGKGLALLSDVVEHPAFHKEDFDRRQKQRLVGISQETDQVSAMAFRVGPKLVYGDQPYGLSGSGTIDSVKSLTMDDVAAFYSAHYGPADSALAIAGDVNLGEAKKLAQKYFGTWTGTASGAPSIPSAPKLGATRVVIVDKPGAPQTALFAFGIGVAANAPDLPALEVMNYTLGGSFGSRINMNLREVHGYTYGAQSGFRTYRVGGSFLAGGQIRTDVTGPAATQLMAEITGFPSHPPTDAELMSAKNSSIQSLPGDFETTDSAAGSTSRLFLYGLPLNYYALLPEKYQALTSADIARVAKEYIHPDQLVIVAAGDRAKIEPQLKDAKIGPVEVRDINATLVK